MLVTRGGHAYTKRLATNTSDAEVAEALVAHQFRAASPPGGQVAARQSARDAAQPSSASRKLAQTGISQSVGAVVSTVSTDLGCDGCPATDTRVQVRGNPKLYPKFLKAPQSLPTQLACAGCVSTLFVALSTTKRTHLVVCLV